MVRSQARFDLADTAIDRIRHADHGSESARIYRDPDNATDDEIASALLDFLIHAPSHIAEAAKLYVSAEESNLSLPR